MSGGGRDGGSTGGGRLVVVSNRVSIPDAKNRSAQGGLAVAMHAALKRHSGIWFGWSGEVSEHPGPPVFQEADGFTVATIDLTPDDYDEYYNGYANRSLWPLFHNLMGHTAYDRQFDRGYFRVNARFARALAPLLRPDDLVWVHDYHLIACAEELRRIGLAQRIGFFLHIPFPPADLLVTLSSHESLVRALFACDQVGFQTETDVRAFRDYVLNEAGGVLHDDGRLEAYGSAVQAGAFPIGIDLDELRELAVSREAARQEARMNRSLNGRKMMIGVDRLDYTKGLENRFLAFERLLAHYPEHRGNLLLLQIAPSSRGEVPEYEAMQSDLEHVCGRINGRFADVDWGADSLRQPRPSAQHAGRALPSGERRTGDPSQGRHEPGGQGVRGRPVRGGPWGADPLALRGGGARAGRRGGDREPLRYGGPDGRDAARPQHDP